jgi:hypothetical protein
MIRFESRRGSKEKEKKKEKKREACFVSWKAYFLLDIFFITRFPLHFKDDF